MSGITAAALMEFELVRGFGPCDGPAWEEYTTESRSHPGRYYVLRVDYGTGEVSCQCPGFFFAGRQRCEHSRQLRERTVGVAVEPAGGGIVGADIRFSPSPAGCASSVLLCGAGVAGDCPPAPSIEAAPGDVQASVERAHSGGQSGPLDAGVQPTIGRCPGCHGPLFMGMEAGYRQCLEGDCGWWWADDGEAA